MISKVTLSTLLVSVVLFASCVSSKKYKAATADATSARKSYDSLLSKTNELQTQLNDAVASNKALVEERDRFQKENESTKQQLSSLQGSVDEYNNSLEDVYKKVSDKMADYAERGVSVQNKDGHVSVAFDDKLLYRPGSSRLSKDGETALATLASVLNENPDLKIMVLGHTDDRAAGGSDTWTLSTERANNVVRAMKTMKIDPSRLTSAGQAHYNAIGDNTTAEGRAQNRRTEILIMPATLKLLSK